MVEHATCCDSTDRITICCDIELSWELQNLLQGLLVAEVAVLIVDRTKNISGQFQMLLLILSDCPARSTKLISFRSCAVLGVF